LGIGGRAVVLEFADPRAAQVIDLLDGSHSAPAIVELARRRGIPEDCTVQVLDALCGRDLAAPAEVTSPPGCHRVRSEAAALALTGGNAQAAQAIRGRQDAKVIVIGQARLAVPIAAGLALAGAGRVSAAVSGPTTAVDVAVGGLRPADLGQPRRAAARQALGRVAPEIAGAVVPERAATIVVEVGTRRPVPLGALAGARRRSARLFVDVQDAVAVIGPLVPSTGSPCLNCLDLHRRDRDPAWPALAAQLATRGDVAYPCAVSTVLAATAWAVEEVLALLDGRLARTIGATVEIRGPGRERRRTFTRHPRCDCPRVAIGTGNGSQNEVQ
jgi:hypothetical protein